jgi:hypothetical protein
MGLRGRGPRWEDRPRGRLTPTRRAMGFVAPELCIIWGGSSPTGLSIDSLIRSAWPGVPRVPLDHVDDAAEVKRLVRPGVDGRPLVSLHQC